MIPSLHDLQHAGCVGPGDAALARALVRLAEAKPDATVEIAIALASRLVAMGHVCLSLSAPPLFDELTPESALDAEAVNSLADWHWPVAAEWKSALLSTGIVESEGGEERSPLVLDAAGRLYLRRYHAHEQALASQLLARAGAGLDVDEPVLQDGLARVFGDADASTTEGERASDGQRRAVEAAMRRRLCVISGGPGTGKTSTVARILVLAVEQARALGQSDPRVVLIAPTGKAAAALTAALSRNLEGVACADDVRDAIPRLASTIHRALGSRGGVGTGFRHDADHPLAADFVVVDEASMVDLALMRRLVEAVPGEARLVMMGDADQLASVEAGAVLAEVCGDTADEDRGGVMASSIVRLTHSYRFAAESGIGQLSRAIRAGDVDEVFEVLRDPRHEDVVWVDRSAPGWPDAVLQCVDDGFAPLAVAESPGEALAALSKIKVLSPHRVGASGVDDLNRRLAARFADLRASRGEGGERWFEPVLVERNDAAAGLWNGDIGVFERGGAGGATVPTYFESTDPAQDPGTVRMLSELRLPPHQPCWAMSVHKSQGSEFDEVLVVLPDRDSPLLSREMLYTAITRARERVVIWGSRELLAASIGRRVERRSGLRDALWSDAPG